MPRYVDPKTGERYENVPDEEAEKAEREFGLIPADKFDRDAAYDAQPLGERVKQAAKGFGMSVARGMAAPAELLDRVLPETWQNPELIEQVASSTYRSTESMYQKERHPFLNAAGESAIPLVTGLMTGGAGAGLAGTAAVLGGEAAVSGLSQEAVDAVTEKRDFSVKSALWNGMLDLAFGAAGHGVGALGREIFGTTSKVAGELAEPPLKRNWLSEIDKGPVPEAGVGARAAQSAGSAAEDFTDDVWDDAIKSIDDGNAGKGMVPEARWFAENAEPIADQASVAVADNLDQIDNIVKNDVSELVRTSDVAKAAETWTPDMYDAQTRWATEVNSGRATQLADVISSASKAAKAGSGEGFEVGGFASKAVKDLEVGSSKIARSQGAERFNAIINLKRNLDGVIRDVGNAKNLNQGDAGQFIAVLRPYADSLREVVRREDLWGAAAPMQGAIDDAWHAVIEPLGRVNQKFSERLGRTWGEVGRSGANRRAKASAVGQMIRQKAVDTRETAKDMAEALEGLQRLGEARQAHGLSRLEAIPRLQKAIQEVRSDLNMGAVLRVARRKAGESGGGLGGEMLGAAVEYGAGKIPGVGGRLGQAGKGALNRLLNSANAPDPSTPLGKVLNQRMKAWSRNPDLADAYFSRELPEWMRKALKEHGGQVAGVGALGTAGALSDDEDAQGGFAAAAVLGLGLGARKLGRARAKLPAGLASYEKAVVNELRSDVLEGRVRSLAEARKFIEERFEDVAHPDPAGLADEVFSTQKSIQDLPELPSAGDGGWKMAPVNQTGIDSAMDHAKDVALKQLSPLERQAVYSYKADAYPRMRAIERGDSAEELARFASDDLGSARELTPALQSASSKFLVKNPTETGMLYRGMNIPDDALADLLSRDELVTHAHTSTSWSPRTAASFATGDGNPVVMRIIHAEEGAPIYNPTEQEVLLPRGARFQVTNKYRSVDESGVPTLVLDVVQRGKVDPRAAASAGALAALVALSSGEASAAEPAPPQNLTPEQLAKRSDLAKRIDEQPDAADIQIRTAEGFGRIAKTTEQRVQGAVRELFASAINPAHDAKRNPATVALERRAQRLGVSRSTARFMGKRNTDLFDAFDQKKETLNAIMLDPGTLAKNMARNLGDLPRLQPELFASMVGQTYRTASYLHERMPGAAGKSMLNPDGFPPTYDEIEEWAGHWSGATAPLDAIEDLAANDLAPEQIDAVKANWPDAFMMFQTTAMKEIGSLVERGHIIPQQALEQIDAALDLNGAGDPVLSWEYASLIQQATAQTQQQAQQAAPAGDPSQFKTPESLASSSLETLKQEQASG